MSSAIKMNTSIKTFILNKCHLTNQEFDCLIEGFIEHLHIEEMNLSNNNLNDKHSYIISRLISRHNQRKDEVLWMYGLRNERPLKRRENKGLVSIDLSRNMLGNEGLEDIVNALRNDNYIRKVDFSYNMIKTEGFSLVNKLLKDNITLLNVNLVGNEGFDEFKGKITFKLAKNIIFLAKSDMVSQVEIGFFSKFIDFSCFSMDVNQESKSILYKIVLFY
jgi:Ran GTPase-activating protein (RanGAP) involved in mRNA processing and transport